MHAQPKAEAARAGPGSYQPGGGGAGAGMGGGGGGGGYRQSAAPVVRQNVAAAFVPISELNPYQNRWTIKVRARHGRRGSARVVLAVYGKGKTRTYLF